MFALNPIAHLGETGQLIPWLQARTFFQSLMNMENRSIDLTNVFKVSLAMSSVLLCIWRLIQLCKSPAPMAASNRNNHESSSDGTQIRQLRKEDDEDPGLLRKHSEFRTFTTARFIYRNLRIFHYEHSQADKLPRTPAPLPLLVFIHGLGGCVAQFHPLLSSLVNMAPCLAIDLPGCGLSALDAKLPWTAYTTDRLTELLEQIINGYRDINANQGVVLIGHSMGASLAAKIAARDSNPDCQVNHHIVGVIAICPRATPPSEEAIPAYRKMLMIPGPLLDLYRRWDRRGGLESSSVRRMVGISSDNETKRLQLRFNKQSRTPVFRRMAAGMLPTYENGIPMDGLAGEETWSKLEVPVFLIAGEADITTKPEEIDIISAFLGTSTKELVNVKPVLEESEQHDQPPNSREPQHKSDLSEETRFYASQEETTLKPQEVDETLPVLVHSSEKRQEVEPKSNIDESEQHTSTQNRQENRQDIEHSEETTSHLSKADSEETEDGPFTPHEEIAAIPIQPARPRKVVKTTVLLAPASHALLYMPSTVRVLSGLISDFLCSYVSPRLSLGWQLQYLSTSGKWDVKNLAKWQAVTPVSEPIAGVFRAMKTLRGVDATHCPECFVRDWHSKISDIIDISHESPVYDPRGLEKGGIRYHKFPTVSKIPPTGNEVNNFIQLVDGLRKDQNDQAAKPNQQRDRLIGVHCHYGFNRTGYFLCCYLIERCAYSVEGALDEFAWRRPKGIRHQHFLDSLYVRYCKGLRGVKG